MTHPIEKWFTGKALQTIQTFVLPTLAEAEKQSFWQKGVSRKIVAALNKQSVATRFARKQERDRNLREDDEKLSGKLVDVCDTRPEWFRAKLSGRSLLHAMMFGQVSHAPELVGMSKKLGKHCVNDAEREALKTAQQWAEDFAPIGTLIEKLDATRPLPTFVLGTLSPTVAANLGKMLGVSFSTIRMPDYRTIWIEREVKGKMMRIPMFEIIWPEGTLHNQSRFSCGSKAGNQQCQACGHAIQNVWNWIPLVADRDGQPPISLWVGRDCAKKLFYVDVKGEAEFKREGVVS